MIFGLNKLGWTRTMLPGKVPQQAPKLFSAMVLTCSESFNWLFWQIGTANRAYARHCPRGKHGGRVLQKYASAGKHGFHVASAAKFHRLHTGLRRLCCVRANLMDKAAEELNQIERISQGNSEPDRVT